METLVERPAPGKGKSSGATPKKDAGDAGSVRGRGRPTSLAIFQDLIAAFRAPGFWLYGAWIDTTVSYRSQALGAFWMVSGTLVSVLLLGTLYSRVLKHNSEIYYAHIATGYALFGFIQLSLQQSTRVFKDNISMIQNGYVRYVDYVLRLVAGQLINLGYNLIVVIGAIALTPVHVTIVDLVLLLTMPLFLLAVLGMCFFLSVVGARYQDVSELTRTVLRLLFFITPIIWMPSSSGKGALLGAFIYANPFYYLIEIIRAPLIYNHIPWFEIGVVLAAIPIIWLVTALAYARAKPFIPLWI
jgi:homopolymeric O-antigen transport system permease protein